jgi:hypothetical protein
VKREAKVSCGAETLVGNRYISGQRAHLGELRAGEKSGLFEYPAGACLFPTMCKGFSSLKTSARAVVYRWVPA